MKVEPGMGYYFPSGPHNINRSIKYKSYIRENKHIDSADSFLQAFKQTIESFTGDNIIGQITSTSV